MSWNRIVMRREICARVVLSFNGDGRFARASWIFVAVVVVVVVVVQARAGVVCTDVTCERLSKRCQRSRLRSDSPRARHDRRRRRPLASRTTRCSASCPRLAATSVTYNSPSHLRKQGDYCFLLLTDERNTRFENGGLEEEAGLLLLLLIYRSLA
jgi:hypothetical protein